MEVPRLGVESELQLPAFKTATATSDPSRISDLHHTSRQCQMLNPLTEARVTSWICFCWTIMGTPEILNFIVVSFINNFFCGYCSLCPMLKIFTNLRSWRYSPLLISRRFFYISHMDTKLTYLEFSTLSQQMSKYVQVCSWPLFSVIAATSQYLDCCTL